jgi:uncharacterized Zn-binding protein involved in type VI secretion
MSSTNAPEATTPGFARARRTILAMVTALAFVLIVLPATASAVTTTWQGDVDGDWATAGNWDTGNAPTNADLAVINNTSDANLFPDPTVSTGAQAADAVTLSGSRVLTVTGGSLAVDNQITAPVGTNVSISGGELKFDTLLVSSQAGFTATGGAIAGTLQATTPVTLTNAGSTYGTSLSTTDGVTLASNVNVNQTANITLSDTHFLNIANRLYTLSGSSILTAALSTTDIDVGSGGRLLHTGAGGGVVQPEMDSSGTLEDDNGANGLVLSSNSGAFANDNLLGGTLKTTGASGLVDLTAILFDSYTVKAGGLTVDNSSGTVRYRPGDNTVDFDLNGQTVSMNGDFTYDGTNGETMSGTGTFQTQSPNFGEFRINDGNFADNANVTIPNGTTARVVGSSDWTNTSVFNINGLLRLDGTNLTAPGPDDPQINISSTGELDHVGGGGLVEPRVVSNGGTIEDQNSGGILNLERTAEPGQTNLYSGTMRTTGNGVLRLGTEVHQLNGPLTMDTTSGFDIITGGGADLQINGQTLTMLGNSLTHASGTISGSGTINGPGRLSLQGGDFALGGVLTVNTLVNQTSPTNIAGAASELRVGGLWLANNNITYSGTGGTFINVLSSGTLRHDDNPASTVSAPLTVAGSVELRDDIAGSDWDLSGGTTITSAGRVSVDTNQLDINPLTNLSGTTLTDGTYTVGAAGTLRFPGPVDTLNADLTIDDGGQVLVDPTNALALADLGAIGSTGSFTLTNGHTEDVSASLTVNGTLAGNGTIVANVFNDGIVSPGTSVGELDITGDYTQSGLGTLETEVEGVGVGEFDILDVDGDVDLGGELALLPSADFVDDAQPGDRASFLRYTGTRLGPDPFDATTVDPPLSNQKAFTADYVDPGKRVDALVGPEPPDVTPPQVTITKKKVSQERRDAKFKFTSNEAGSTFECKLDKRPWRKCASPRNYGDLDPGKHKFKVRATDPSGNTSTPAKKKFKIKV